MFQANAFQVNAFQIGALGGVIPPVVEETRGKGGWDPYYYKKRKKRVVKAADVQDFLEEVSEASLVAAPAVVIQKAQEATQSAEAYLAGQVELKAALADINAFYAALRIEAKRRAEDDEDDDDIFLLSF